MSSKVKVCLAVIERRLRHFPGEGILIFSSYLAVLDVMAIALCVVL
jgi:hypothetical protein